VPFRAEKGAVTLQWTSPAMSLSALRVALIRHQDNIHLQEGVDWSGTRTPSWRTCTHQEGE